MQIDPEEVYEVLVGLARPSQIEDCWCAVVEGGVHDEECMAARRLWAQVCGGRSLREIEQHTTD